MAVFALTGAYVSINSVDYSGDLKQATLTVDAAQLDPTNFKSEGWIEVLGGMKSGQLQLVFNDDVADDAVDEELWALLGTTVAFEFRAKQDSVGASNPSYEGNVFVAQHTIGGTVGDLAAKSLTFPLSGKVTRATS